MSVESLLSLIVVYRYWILFPLACVEGPVVAMVVGFLVSLGAFELLPVYVILLFGDIVPDSLFYWLGRTGHRTALVQRAFAKRLPAIEHFWHRHTFKSMLVAKWALTLSPALLISAGMARLPFGRYLRAALPITAFQYAVTMGFGYFFGLSYKMFEKTLFVAQGIVAMGVVLFIIVFFLLTRFATRSLPLREV